MPIYKTFISYLVEIVKDDYIGQKSTAFSTDGHK